MKVAALFVETGGCYFGLPDVEPWDRPLDARMYCGPYPIVAHPPCERWGRYWGGAPWQKERKKKGDDAGCFEAALRHVRAYGGIIEHPEASHAWAAFGLNKPPKNGGWVAADWFGGWTCCVEQGHYGHAAAKAAWLYAHSVELPKLAWGGCGKKPRIDQGCHSKEERARLTKTGICQRLSRKQRLATPIPFRDLLLSIARTAA